MSRPRPYEHLISVGVVTVDGTAKGKTLATLLGASLEQGIAEIMLIPADGAGTINFNDGDASAATGFLPTTGLSLLGTKALLDELKFFATSGSESMTVIQMG